jgi:hypothetical protein
MLMTHHQNAREIHIIKRVYRSFESVAKLKYLGTAVTNKNLIHEEVKNN